MSAVVEITHIEEPCEHHEIVLMYKTENEVVYGCPECYKKFRIPNELYSS